LEYEKDAGCYFLAGWTCLVSLTVRAAAGFVNELARRIT